MIVYIVGGVIAGIFLLIGAANIISRIRTKPVLKARIGTNDLSMYTVEFTVHSDNVDISTYFSLSLYFVYEALEALRMGPPANTQGPSRPVREMWHQRWHRFYDAVAAMAAAKISPHTKVTEAIGIEASWREGEPSASDTSIAITLGSIGSGRSICHVSPSFKMHKDALLGAWVSLMSIIMPRADQELTDRFSASLRKLVWFYDRSDDEAKKMQFRSVMDMELPIS